MNSSNTLQSIPALCHGSRTLLQDWLMHNPARSLIFCIPTIILGCGVYGFTMGIWQGWTMATYVAIKLPLVIFATLIVNGLINGMLAMAIGSGISFRQSFQFLLAGFALMSLILLSLSPIALFVVYHAPEATSIHASQSHDLIMLSHTLMIAYAGIISHRSLLGQVRYFSTSPSLGNRTFFAWLAGNLFVGAQISWVMRPFFGTPGLDVEFLRDKPLNGSFYETIWNTLVNLIFT